MLGRHFNNLGAVRHGKRQLDSTLANSITTLVVSRPPPQTTPLIPPIPPTTLTTITVSNPNPTITNIITISTVSVIGNGSPPSPFPNSRFTSSPPPTPSPPTAPPATQLSAPSSVVLASEVTSMFTTISDSHPVTVTTIIRPAASLSPDEHPSNSFLDNKAKTGAVFAVVALVILAGVGFLGYRFYKTVQSRKADRETEEAARAAARVRVRLDDDDDTQYGAVENPFSSDMAQLHSQPYSVRGDSNFHSDMGQFDGAPSGDNAAPHLPYPVSLHQPSGSLQMQAALERYSAPTDDVSDTMQSRRSSDSGEDLLPARSNTPGGLHSTKSDSVTRSPLTSHSASSQPSGSVASNSTTSPFVTRPQWAAQPERPPPPILPLPAAFGESDSRSIRESIIGDDVDYHGTKGLVLKIANE